MIAIYLPTTDHFFQLDLTDTIWTLDYVNTARHIASHEFFQPTVHIRTVRPWLLFRFGTLDSFLPGWSDLKSVNLQYNTLVWRADGTKDSSTKRLMSQVQWNLDSRKPDLRKNLDLRKIVGTTDFLVHKLFDLRKIFKT